MERERLLKLSVLFVLSYIILYSLGMMIPELHDWGFTLDWSRIDYMFYLIPITGFFFMYFLVEWVDAEFKTAHAHSFVFPIVFVALALVAFYVMLYWYFANFAELSGRDEVVFDYLPILLDSAYIYFILASLAGWFSHVILDRFDSIETPEGTAETMGNNETAESNEHAESNEPAKTPEST